MRERERRPHLTTHDTVFVVDVVARVDVVVDGDVAAVVVDVVVVGAAKKSSTNSF